MTAATVHHHRPTLPVLSMLVAGAALALGAVAIATDDVSTHRSRPRWSAPRPPRSRLSRLRQGPARAAPELTPKSVRSRSGCGRAVLNLPDTRRAERSRVDDVANVHGWEDVSVPRRATSPVLIGRTGERASLAGAFRAAVAGAPVTVLVAGEAGVGKTRLVTEFVRDVGAEATALFGACIDERVPYSPIADALRSLARSGWDPNEVEGRGWAELGAISPDRDRSPETACLVRTARRGGFTRRSSRCWKSLCAERPVVVVVEDLHWSDASTRNLLMHTMRAARQIPLLLVGTYRTDELTRRHPLRPFLAEVARLRSTDVVELGRLDAEAVGELIAATVGSRPSQAMVSEVYERCGGNPFLVEEVIAAGVAGGSGRLPPRLRDILLARTTSLTPQAAEVLRLAAVGGPRIDDALLRRVSSLEPGVLDSAVRELLDCNVLEPHTDDRCYVFRHALTAEAVYEDTLPGERVRLHTTFADAIGDDPSLATAGGALAAVERARHWHRARHGLKALPAWVEAAAAAERVYAHPEALAAYENALELWPTIDGPETLAGFDEIELLRRAAEAANRAGLSDRALTLAQNAMALVDERAEPLRAAALNERIGRYTWVSGHEGEAPSYYQRAVELADGLPPSVERARALAGHAQILALNWLDAAAGKRAQEAIDEARRAGAVAVEAHALITMATVVWPRAMRLQRCRLSRSRRGSSSAARTTRTSPACRTTGCTTSSPWAASRRPPTPPRKTGPRCGRSGWSDRSSPRRPPPTSPTCSWTWDVSTTPVPSSTTPSASSNPIGGVRGRCRRGSG